MNDPVAPLEQLVQTLSCFAPLDQEDQEAIYGLASVTRELPAGGYLIREFQRPGPCQVLLAGFAMRSKFSVEGARQITGIQLPGDLLDIQHLYLDQADHSLQALTNITVAEIDRMQLQGLVETRINILRAVFRADEVEGSIAREWLLNVGQRTGRQRIAHLICETAVRLKRQNVDDMFGYVLPMTQEQLGDATGMTAVHVNRMLKQLVSEGCIARDRHKTTILNWERLSEAADFNPSYLHLQPSSR